MTDALNLRGYQSECLEALETGWQTQQRLGVSLPTGAGKTVIMAHLAHRSISAGERVLITVHRDELVEQTVDKLRRVDRRMSVGVVKAARNQGGAAVVVASVQTLARPERLRQIGRFGLIVVDEAHRSMSDSYQRVLAGLDATNPFGPRVAGFTATWSRSDSRGLGDFWEGIAFERSLKWAIDQGHLVRPVGRRVVTELDLSGVKKLGGDYADRALGIVMTDASIRDAVVTAYQRHAADRQGVLFAPTVAAAEFFAAGLTAAGIRAEGLFGATSDTAAVHRRHRAGETQVLATCTKLAEGWDAPWCSAAVLARPTLHRGLFVQQVGRVLRPWPGKSDAVVLDVVGTSDRHSLVSETDLGLSPAREPDADAWDLEAELEERGPRGKVAVDAAVVGIEAVDLFAGSDARWLVSAQGAPFVRTKNAMYFLWPVGSDWAVGRCGAHSLAGGQWLMTDSDPEAMLLWAGQLATEEDPSVAAKSSAWRRTPRPSARQVEYAESLGLAVPDGATRSSVADQIDVALASRVLAGLTR